MDRELNPLPIDDPRALLCEELAESCRILEKTARKTYELYAFDNQATNAASQATMLRNGLRRTAIALNALEAHDISESDVEPET